MCILSRLVDVGGRGAGAGGDAALALAVEDFWAAALLRRHRRNDRALALHHLVVDSASRLDLTLHLGDAGDHPHQAAHAAHPLDLLQLLGEIVEVEGALLHLLGDLVGLLHVDRLSGLFDEADDVAHAENAAGDAGGVEVLQRVPLLADTEQLDRLAGDGAHRERSAAAAVAVGAGQHDAGDADAARGRPWRC